ncbi:MAG: pyridoxal phosphate-dependent aminotransferase [Dehalococcoidales bacterium]|nr:pyridoxal phosphate-dependent aminotransferase [Dehalococcoidales bacterium]
MKYDFDSVPDRKNTGSAKWDAVKTLFGRDDILPMWVADMDFPAAKPVVDALEKRARHPFYGYSYVSESLIEAIVARMYRKFRWRIKPEWILLTPGVIPALSLAVRSLTHPGDGIILQEPVYYPFFPVVTTGGCQIINNGLKLVRGRYEMDLVDLEEKFLPKTGMGRTPSRAKAILLCNPHNPVGRLWNKTELVKLGEIALKHSAVVISDEIHCEILYTGNWHTPFASISEEFAQNSIVCMAPSKTFNLAGLEASSIIIPNKKLRDNFTEQMSALVTGVNIFGLTAMEAAYRDGDEWLAQVLDYLESNLRFTQDFFKKRVPEIKVIKPQATYLIWLDCRKLGLDNIALRKFMREKARVGFDDGFLFGNAGSGFQRMNIACPRSLLQEALNRIEAAVNSL